YGEFYGDTLLVEYPTGSTNKINLTAVANELTKKVISLFEKEKAGKRRLYGNYSWFYEYFHGDNGRGLGASHQTGWTALVAELISEYGENVKTNIS
ncbi:MAG: glucosidase, partial [Chitinophagaceae bacterium]